MVVFQGSDAHLLAPDAMLLHIVQLVTQGLLGAEMILHLGAHYAVLHCALCNGRGLRYTSRVLQNCTQLVVHSDEASAGGQNSPASCITG